MPTEEQAEEIDCAIFSAWSATPGGTLLQYQSAFDRANQDLYEILHLVIHRTHDRGRSGTAVGTREHGGARREKA